MNAAPPDSISWLIDAVGEDEALRFIETVGGQRLIVPMNSSGSNLEKCWGPVIAEGLCDRFGGTAWFVPVARPWRVGLYSRMGMTINEITVRAGVSYSAVVKLRSAGRTASGRRAARPVDERQTALF
ncbi:MAG: hypothetical protein LKH33_10440 [Acetobacter sp.]|jgi:hypothetical protein|nr:hypothetical protein [Acetobacter sp.]MCH4060558.1 hypothetical protein [Acetobacter sp.]MCH4087498.1 hypothetical protein [Acetobacter sp.]MCI1294699.1 hypothetical protein [Acetobacter sp.]MCI1321152.1 hypothetical protein [Acetobacter sp.]